tara:strand:- start:129 stop:458 length:330 start_codon:yes stop_codon:yes gene_type:complete
MKSFDPFSEEGRAWLDYNSEEDEFGAYENLGKGRARVHSIPRKKKKVKSFVKAKSYVKEKGSDEKGDYLVFGGKRKRRKSRRRKRKTKRKAKQHKKRRRTRRRRRRKRR